MITRKLILICTISLLTFTVYSQKIANKQFALLNYDLTINKDIAEELSSLDSYIKDIKTYNDPGNNKLEAIFVHVIYYTLKDKFEEQLSIEVLPTNTFLRKVKYNDYGYPKTTIRDAMKIGYSRYYFKVNATLASLTEETMEKDTLMYKDIDFPTIYPKISLEVIVYNKDGVIPIFKWYGESTPRYPLPINEYLLKGFDNKTMEVLPLTENQDENIYLMLDRAIQSVIQDYTNR